MRDSWQTRLGLDQGAVACSRVQPAQQLSLFDARALAQGLGNDLTAGFGLPLDLAGGFGSPAHQHTAVDGSGA